MFEEHNAFGLGISVKKREGEMVFVRTVRHWGMAGPELAEVMAIKESLSWAMESDVQKILNESDCLVIVQAIRNKVPMFFLVGLVIEECRELLCSQKNVSLLFIKRSANVAAHSLARA